MDKPLYNYQPVMKVPHYRRCRVRWLSFQTPIDKKILFITLNGFGNKITQTNPTGVPMKYFFSMPIVLDNVIAFNVSNEDAYWVELPQRINLKTITLSAFYEGSYEGNPDPTFVTVANPISLAIDFGQ